MSGHYPGVFSAQTRAISGLFRIFPVDDYLRKSDFPASAKVVVWPWIWLWLCLCFLLPTSSANLDKSKTCLLKTFWSKSYSAFIFPFSSHISHTAESKYKNYPSWDPITLTFWLIVQDLSHTQCHCPYKHHIHILRMRIKKISHPFNFCLPALDFPSQD